MTRRAVPRLVSCAITLVGVCAISSALAQGYPSRPVRMVIAFPPGGPTDLAGRVIASKVAEQVGQQVVVENRAGGGGNIGADAVAKSAPDGDTIFYNTSAIAIAPSIYSKLSYDVLKGFASVALTATVPLVLVVNPAKVPAKSVTEFVSHAKAQHGKINYASSGTGVVTHLAGAVFVKEMGIQATHVP
jgi:tripartite-type tricarboxylate transporter receptor subunit TctC